MARRGRRYRSSRRGVEIAQIIMLIVLLVAVLFFRGQVGEISSKLINVFGPAEDVQIKSDPAVPPAPSVPAGDEATAQ
jgi:hypothetical protein